MTASPLVDRYGRTATDLRVSLTDRCNLRCSYCMPAEGLDWLPDESTLTEDEVVRLVRIAVERLGVREVRFTGGEPLVRRGLVDIVRQRAQTLDERLRAIYGEPGEDNAPLQEWLDRHALGSAARFWQKLRIDHGWETAAEAVLRERLHALELSGAGRLEGVLADGPPSKASVFDGGSGEARPRLLREDAVLRHQEITVRELVAPPFRRVQELIARPVLQRRRACPPRRRARGGRRSPRSRATRGRPTAP